MVSALAGLKILDLTRVRAGPTCVRVLADFGADVIKIEPPPGVDPNEGMSGLRHGYDMQNLHRNKRSLTLNLKSDEGRSILLRMVKTADVVVENFRPDVKDRLGLAYDELANVNPRVILASISGYGQTGPYRLRGGFDQIAQGMGGLMWLTGQLGEGPMRTGIAVADTGAGLFAALGILIALTERATSGRGQWVQTSLLESQIAMLDFQAAQYLVDGIVPQQAGNDHPYVTPMGAFKTADGYINIGVAGHGMWQKFCHAIGRTDLMSDERFATESDRLRNRPELNRILAELFLTKSTQHLTDFLTTAGIPAGPIYRMNEVFADPQVQHLEIAKEVDHPVRGRISLVGTPIGMSRTPPVVVRPIPEVGEQSQEILAEFGYSAQDVQRLRSKGVV